MLFNDVFLQYFIKMISQELALLASGTYIDFKDKDTNDWQVGLIIGKTKSFYRVRTEGWSSKYDELIPFASNRIKSFRSVVRGYTGQVKSNAVRQHWKFSPQDHQERLIKIREIVQKTQLTRQQWNQFIRGQHYFYLDFLLGQTYTSKEQLEPFYQYLKYHLALANNFLTKIKVDVKQWFSSEKQEREDRESYYEILDGVYILAGLNIRHFNFQKDNGKIIAEFTSDLTHQKYVAQLIKEVGLDVTYMELVQILNDCKDVQFPISFAYTFFRLFLPIQKALLQRTEAPFDNQQSSKIQRKNILLRLFQFLKRRMEQIEPSELKLYQNEKEIQGLLSESMAMFFKYGLDKLTFEWIAKSKVQIAILLLQTDSLQRKMKGIGKLKQLFQTSISPSQYVFYKLTVPEYIKIINGGNVLHKIFLQNQHPEILKKGADLWINFYQAGAILFEELKFIWDKCILKHEAVKKIIYQFWIDLIPHAKESLHGLVQILLTACENQSNILKEQWEISMLLAFAEKLTAFYNEQKNEDIKEPALCQRIIEAGYKKLNVLSESSNCSQKISELAKLINNGCFFNTLIRQCFIQIGKGINLSFHLQLLTRFYLQTTSKDTFLASNSLSIILSQLENHPQQSSDIFKLVTEVCNYAKSFKETQLFGNEQFERLWILSHKNEQIKGIFYDWILRQVNQGAIQNGIFEISPIISGNLREHIFKQYLCNFNKLDYINLSLKQFNIFKQFLIQINMQQQKIESNRMASMVQIVKVKSVEIVGSKFVWDIFLNCKNDAVLKSLNKFLIVLHFHFHPTFDFQHRKIKVMALLARIQKHLKDAYRKGNERLMKSSLGLLRSVLDVVKQKAPEEQERYNHFYYKHNHKIRNGAVFIEVESSLSSTYHTIKQKIAEKLKLQITRFQLKNKNDQLIGYELANIPFCFSQEKDLEVTLINENQETILKILNGFLSTKLESVLIQIIEVISISEYVYKVLEELQLTSQSQKMTESLNKAISKQRGKKGEEKISSAELYLRLLQLKIVRNQIDKSCFDKFQTTKNIILDQIKLFGSQIDTPLMVIYLSGFGEILFKFWKICSTKEEVRNVYLNLNSSAEELCERSLSQILLLCKSINEESLSGESNLKKVKIFFNCLNIIDVIKGLDMIQYMLSHSSFQTIITRIYLHNSLPEIRLLFTQKIKKIINNVINNTKQQKDNEVSLIIQKLVKLFVQKVCPSIFEKDGLESGEKSVFYFYNFIAFLIEKLSTPLTQVYIIESTFYPTINARIKQMRQNRNRQTCNYILKGYLDILSAIYEKQPSLLSLSQVQFILQDCLSLVPGSEQIINGRCHSNLTIGSCLNVLLAGCKMDYKKILSVTSSLKQFHLLEYWRNEYSWQVAIESQKKQKYKGLDNPGCICYLNSFLQQLYMNTAFRNQLMSIDVQKSQIEQNKLSVLKQLKFLFFQLQESEESSLDSVPFTKTIKGYDDKPMIRIFNQMDIDEFSNILFDRMETQLLAIGQQDFVKNMFGGIYSHQIISEQCPHSSQREQNFLSIGLQVKKNISESFECLIRGEMLDGQNKYYCERCDRKVRAQKLVTIKKVPNFLIIALKRFQYNYQIDAKIKLNDYCQFPDSLDLLKFSEAYRRKNRTKSLQVQDLSQVEQEIEQGGYKYQLSGVVIHSGSTDSGHYYSLIKDETGTWFQFNDSTVQPFQINKLAEEAYGSADPIEEKSKNAYLLFYKKIGLQKLQKEVKVSKEVTASQQNAKIVKTIHLENQTIQKYKLFFSAEYREFVEKLWIKFEQTETSQIQRAQFYKYILTFFLAIRIREGTFDDLQKFSLKIQELLKRSYYCRKILLQVMKSLTFLQEIFVYCYSRNKCKVITSLLAIAVLVQEQSQENRNEKKQLLKQILISINCITTLHGNIHELSRFLRQILVSDQGKRQDLINFLIQINFQKTMLINLLGNSFLKQQKQVAIKRRQESKDNSINIVGKPSKEARKYMPSQTNQSWRVLSYILQSMANKEEYLQKNIDVKIMFEKQLNPGTFCKIIYEATNQRAIYFLFKSIQAADLLQNIYVSIQKGLKDYESTKFRPFLLLLLYIVGQCSDEKHVQQIVKLLERVLLVNQKYFLQVNLIHQWIEKMFNFSKLFENKFMENLQLVDKILVWIHNNPKPAMDLLKKHKNPQNDRLLNRINGILVGTNPKAYEQDSQALKQKLILMLKGQRKNKIKPVWSQEFNFQYKIGVQLSYFNKSAISWQKYTVVSSRFGVLKIKMEGKKQVIELSEDDERIRPYWAYQNDRKINEIVPVPVVEPLAVSSRIDNQEDLYS